jgi:hypothetical protein
MVFFSKYVLFIFKLISLLSFILFRKHPLNDNYFFGYAFKFHRVFFYDSSIIFLSFKKVFYDSSIIFKNKKIILR